ncbi:MAG: HAD hydrolase-like protein [Bacteroidota bacterium]
MPQQDLRKPIVLLDLGGVVFQTAGTSNETINWEIIGKLNGIYGHDFNLGRDVFPAFMREYRQQSGLDLSGEAFLEGVYDTLTFNKDLVSLLRKTHDIIIVSDNYRENIAYSSKRFHFSEWAIDQYYSFDYALEKSDPAFFIRLIKELEMPGESLIYIDDSPKKLESAALQGIKGILFEGNKAFAEKWEQKDD